MVASASGAGRCALQVRLIGLMKRMAGSDWLLWGKVRGAGALGLFSITEEVASEIKADRMNEKKDKSMKSTLSGSA